MLRNLSQLNVTSVRNFAAVKNFTPKPSPFRQRLTWEHFTPTNGNFGKLDPINDARDWSYVDENRVTPLTQKQVTDKLHQLKLAERIVQYLGELKEAENEFSRKVELKNAAVETKQARRPKAKGNLRS